MKNVSVHRKVGQEVSTLKRLVSALHRLAGVTAVTFELQVRADSIHTLFQLVTLYPRGSTQFGCFSI